MVAGKYPTGKGSFSTDWVRANLVLPGPVETRHALSLQRHANKQ